ncbi:MAG: diphthamide synthesis protein [Candidatus Woesearchaeota archaeon]
MNYDLELDRAVKAINENEAKQVCIQLPDGLKPKAGEIVEYLEQKTPAKVFIWSGSCFGACDTPLLPKGFDLLIQWGHSAWKN